VILLIIGNDLKNNRDVVRDGVGVFIPLKSASRRRLKDMYVCRACLGGIDRNSKKAHRLKCAEYNKRMKDGVDVAANNGTGAK
jgi:hypothetical protein